jgi:hypothetical protein
VSETASRAACHYVGVEQVRVVARRVRTLVVVAVMLAATLLVPVALPVAVIVRWMRRDAHRIEHVVSAPNVALLVPRDHTRRDVAGRIR